MNSLPIGGPIRSLLPERLEAEGFECRTRQASGRELSGLLGQGLSGAAQNFLQAPDAESAAELLDLLAAACEHHGISWDEVKAEQARLSEEEGQYQDLVLEALQRRPGA